jgi:hypothetical protein
MQVTVPGGQRRQRTLLAGLRPLVAELGRLGPAAGAPGHHPGRGGVHHQLHGRVCPEDLQRQGNLPLLELCSVPSIASALGWLRHHAESG